MGELEIKLRQLLANRVQNQQLYKTWRYKLAEAPDVAAAMGENPRVIVRIFDKSYTVEKTAYSVLITRTE